MTWKPLPVLRTAALAWLLAVAAPAARPDAPVAADEVRPEGAAEGTPPCCRTLKPRAALPGNSLYQLDSEWTSDVGRRIRLSALAGRPQVVTLFFTRCEYACPILAHDLRRIEAALSPEARDKVDFLLITLDPERDTPEALHAFRRTRKLPMSRWTLLRGDPDDVLELAAVLGVSYRRDARGQFLHSNRITLLDADGAVVQELDGLRQDVGAFVERIESLARN